MSSLSSCGAAFGRQRASSRPSLTAPTSPDAALQVRSRQAEAAPVAPFFRRRLSSSEDEEVLRLSLG